MSPIVSKVETVAKLAGPTKLIPAEAALGLKDNTDTPFKSFSSDVPATNAKLKASFTTHFRWEYMAAGIAGGVVSTTVLHPLDLIKIRFQVSEGKLHNSSRPTYSGITDAVVKIHRQEGVRGLYKGLSPNVMGAGLAWGSYFLFYNSSKDWISNNMEVKALGPVHNMSAAAVAGIASLIVTNPIWVAKTRLCLQYDTKGTKVDHYRGTFDCMTRIFRKEGIKGLYKGFTPGLFGVSHGALQFMAYEELQRRYNSYMLRKPGTKFNTLEYLSFAAISKLFAAGLTYPYQVVRSRLQDQHRSYNGVTDVIRKTWTREGARGFYKGLGPYLLHVTPNICMVFIIYERLADWLIQRNPSTTTSSAISVIGGASGEGEVVASPSYREAGVVSTTRRTLREIAESPQANVESMADD